MEGSKANGARPFSLKPPAVCVIPPADMGTIRASGHACPKFMNASASQQYRQRTAFGSIPSTPADCPNGVIETRPHESIRWRPENAAYEGCEHKSLAGRISESAALVLRVS